MNIVQKIKIGVAIWLALQIPLAYLVIGLINRGMGRCFFHALKRRLVIEAGAYEYFECPVCGIREAEKIEGIKSLVNHRWLGGKPWVN